MACQRSAARIMAPNMSLSTAFSPKALGMILSRLRSSTNRRSRRFVVLIARRWAIGMRRVRDAGLEVVLEAGARAGQLGLVVGEDTAGEIVGNGAGGGLVGGGDARLELRPEVVWHLGRQVAHAMGEAALMRRAREAGLDRLDDARRTVRDYEQGIAEAAPAHVLEEGAHRLRVLLGAGHRRQHVLGPQMGCTLAGARQRGDGPDGRASPACPGAAPGDSSQAGRTQGCAAIEDMLFGLSRGGAGEGTAFDGLNDAMPRCSCHAMRGR